jgi:hypothetical protein
MYTQDLIYTLEVCKKSLPAETHPTHFERLREIERLIKKGGNDKQWELLMSWMQAAVDELSKLEADRGIRILADGGRALIKEAKL